MKIKAVYKEPPEELVKKKINYEEWVRALLNKMNSTGVNCLELEPEPGEVAYKEVAKYSRVCKTKNIPLEFHTVNKKIFILRSNNV